MARLARAMGIRPPSLYKYYPSLLAVYDALFRRGQLANLEALREGMRGAAPGLDAVGGALEAAGRWAVANPVLAQLLFWRPVPGYKPLAEAFAPAMQIIDLLRSALADAAARGQVHHDAATDSGMELLSIRLQDRVREDGGFWPLGSDRTGRQLHYRDMESGASQAASALARRPVRSGSDIPPPPSTAQGCSAIPPPPVTALASCSPIPPAPVTALASCSAIPPAPVTALASCSAIPPPPATALASCSSVPPPPQTALASCSSIPPPPVTALASCSPIPPPPSIAHLAPADDTV